MMSSDIDLTKKMTKPNILLLFTDQQRIDTINAAGANHMHTPNLDRLVKEGCLYTNAYSPNPVCIPARHNLLTGLPAKFHGYDNNRQHAIDYHLPVLPRILADNGYDTRAIGKMHFVPVRRHHGFNKMELMEETPKSREDDEYAMYLKENGLGNILNIHGIRNLLYYLPQRSLIPDEHHGSSWVADRSVKYIKKNHGRRPFFLWSSWIAPHPPFDIPDSYADMYKDKDLPETFKSKTPASWIIELRGTIPGIPEDNWDDYVRRMREVYYSAVSFVDYNIGKVLDALEETGQMENTIIIFTTDHGEMLGDHDTFGKSCAYDSSAKIPFIIRYPKKFKPGSSNQDFCDLNDIMPTLLDLADIEYPGEIELPGGSLLKDSKDRRYQYMEHCKDVYRWISIRDKDFKYNYHYRGPYEELFDMRNDPNESTNLLYEQAEKYKNIRNKLKSVLLSYEQKWGLEGSTNENGFTIFPEPKEKDEAGMNKSFPRFQYQIQNPEEYAAMNDFSDEILEVIEKEELSQLENLDLEQWLAKGGPEKLIKSYIK